MLVRVALLFLALLLFPFPIAGRWDWWGAWANGILLIVSFIVSRVILARVHPDLLAERGRFLAHKDMKPWDRLLAPIVGLFGFLATALVAALDLRFDWQPQVPFAIELTGLAIVLLGNLLASWALIANRFFSGVVRIQKERGHTVVDTGPYHYIRHPGYLGGVISDLAIPLLFGSYWALIPALLTVAALFLRTALEDRTLQNELPGYAEYAQKTRYRLIPGVW
jgi:protein-S-isoprenylcysteine O-methyltransferase Ste14